MTKRPLEIRVAATILAAAAVAFVALGLVGLAAGTGSLRFPILLAVIGLLAAASILFGLPRAGGLVIGFASLAAIAQVLIALGDLPAWVRVGTGVLAAAHAYVVVLLLTRPAREFLAKGTAS
ncbi:hypothetical protein [Actinokineospora sp. NBRC 105648]|uniref:hypothetical protein n=1 Tax=Actinokineospora sp. NBRC 105648 TaxID=3032206 RepID=UPI0024A5261E|nr:hypothetical protein [Actinokineospora sp. NBRC 105648]GLZ39424.1 hypothetical protein Acsp05_30480 [Actinokineospora sp. NBRC 105648]